MKLKDLVKAPISEDVADVATETATEPSTDGVKLSDIWAEQGSNSATYVPRQQFAIKKIGDEYEVNLVNNSERKLLKKITQDQLESTYSQVGKEADAEGYTSFVSKSVVDAFTYDGDSIIIKNGGKEATLMKGDYVVKRIKATGFEFLVVEKNEFEAKYVERT